MNNSSLARATSVGNQQTEIGVLPDDWNLIEIGSIAKVIDGDRGRNYPNADDFSESGYCLFLNAGNVTNQGFKFENCAFITREKDKKLSKGKLQRKDIVLTTRGTVGNFALFNEAVPFDHMRINSGMVILRNDDGDVETDFLYAFLRSYAVEKQIERLAFGSAQPQLTVRGISKLLITLPPTRKEQCAIAEALNDVDALLDSLGVLITKKRDLKQAAMQQLLTGRTRLPSFNHEWKERQLGDEATFLKGKGLPKSAVNRFGPEPCIHYGQLFTRYKQTIREINSRTDAFVGCFRSVANDVLMPTSDVTPRGLAKASCIPLDGVIIGGDILVIRTDPSRIFGPFLSYLIRYQEQQVLQLVTGTTVFHLYGSDMKKFGFLMPPITEQKAIVAVLDDMDSEIAALEERREKTANLKQAMMQELLTGKTRLV